ncbi:DsbA family protein [Streptomyces sp. NPDC048248]|uniref:DsbA family protein n=1 Tax=Streptomyces sp. NPDC048248 TaxID=3365523 RepID=UPI0037235984
MSNQKKPVGAGVRRPASATLRAQTQRAKERRTRRRRATAVACCIVPLAGIGVLGKLLADRSADDPSVARAASGPVKVPAGAAPKDPTTISYGSARAKNTLDVYEDPRCPMCGILERSVGKEVRRLAEQGTVKVNYHFAVFIDRTAGGKGSRFAVSALGAAADQDLTCFQRLHEELFAHQPDETDDGFGNAGHLLDLAARVHGLRSPSFDAAVRDLRYLPWAESVGKQFQRSGPDGTPQMELNGQRLDVFNDRGEPLTPNELTQLVRERGA